MSVKALETALDTRLRDDAILGALIGQGIWNMIRPGIEYDSGDLSWVEFVLQGGGDANQETGRWKDVLMFVRGHASVDLGAARALDIDARLETLLHGWTPTLTGWSEVLTAWRERSIQWTGADQATVREYVAGALYRFRFGTPTEPTPPATTQSTATSGDGDKPLIQAVYDRMQEDSTLVGLAPAGVWFGAVPTFSDMRQVQLSGGTPSLTSTSLMTSTWVEVMSNTGGPTNDATGPLFRDSEIRVRARSFVGAGAAIDADERIDTLLVNWSPPIGGYEAGWKVERVTDERIGIHLQTPDRPMWEAGGVYRLRIERSS